jgi:hypothetical protein
MYTKGELYMTEKKKIQMGGVLRVSSNSTNLLMLQRRIVKPIILLSMRPQPQTWIKFLDSEDDGRGNTAASANLNGTEGNDTKLSNAMND